MRLQLCDGVKNSWLERSAALIFITALFFLYRPIMAAGFFRWAGITVFTEGLFVFLAMGAILFRWETLRSSLRNTNLLVKICLAVLLGFGLLHWAVGRYYHPEFLGLSLYWGILPLFGLVYRNDLERKLPAVLGAFWLCNVIVCIWVESATGEMFGLTGNWNWSAMLMLVTFPFALRCVPLDCKGRKLYLILMWVVTLVLMRYLQSRAMVLSAAVAGAFWVFLKYRKYRIPMAIAAVVLLIGAGFAAWKVFPERTQAFCDREIRIELWKGTVEMIKDCPLGVGAASFENSFISYRSEKYFKNPHCAIRDNHPHNEILFLASTLGVSAALAFVILIVAALVGAVKEYDAGMMSRKRLLFLLSFIAILCSSMLDLTLHVWPLGILGLLYFGMFAFPGKRVPEKVCDGPANRIGKTVFVLTLLMAAANLVGTFCWEASHECIRRMNIPQAKNYAKTAHVLAPHFPNLVYRTANEMLSRDQGYALELAESFQETPWADYAHIHGLKSLLYAQKGDYLMAIEESLLEAEIFPLQIRPIVDVYYNYARSGHLDPEVSNRLSREYAARIKKRNLTNEQVKAILQNPEYDMHPERIGKTIDKPIPWDLP